MKNKKLILLVDGENILHQSFHKFEKLKSTKGVKTELNIWAFQISRKLSLW